MDRGLDVKIARDPVGSPGEDQRPAGGGRGLGCRQQSLGIVGFAVAGGAVILGKDEAASDLLEEDAPVLRIPRADEDLPAGNLRRGWQFADSHIGHRVHH
jgi:hypothetical protein